MRRIRSSVAAISTVMLLVMAGRTMVAQNRSYNEVSHIASLLTIEHSGHRNPLRPLRIT